MKKRVPIDPNARICQCCGYANLAATSACRLCGTQLPEQRAIQEPPLEPPAPPAYKPLPFRSRPPVPPTPQPLPVQSQPPAPPPPVILPPPVIPRQEKPPATVEEPVPLAKEPIAPPLSHLAMLRLRIGAMTQKRERRSQPPKPSRLTSELRQTSSRMIAATTKTVDQTFSGLATATRKLFSLVRWLGQQSSALKPRVPSWRPNIKFQTSGQYRERERLSTGESHAASPGSGRLPRLRSLTLPVLSWRPNLTPAMSFGRQAFFFFAGLGGLVLKALLSALIFLLKQGNQLLKWLWSLRTARPATESTIKPTIKPTAQPTIKPTFNFNLRRAVKYSGGALASLVVLAVLGLSFATLQRSWASWRAAKPAASEIKIEEDYQSASQRTWVKLEPVQITGKQFDGLSLSASFSYAGRKLKQEPGSITLSLTSVAPGFKYAERPALTVQTDWETIKLGAMNRNGQQITVSSDGKIEVVKPSKKNGGRGDHVLETLTLNVPTAIWTKIAQSKEVKMKVGQTEFELADIHLTAWRDLLERATATMPTSKRSAR